MRVVLLLALGACSFEHGSSSTSGGSGSSTVDAPRAPGDGTMATPDAPCGDSDSDGVCNSADDWPCGAKPPAPPSGVSFTEGDAAVAVSNTDLHGQGRLAVAAPSANLSLALIWVITDTGCVSNCVDQLEVGWVPGGRLGCLFDGMVSKSTGASGLAVVGIRAPSAAGVYDLRIHLGKNNSCGTTTTWYGGGTPAVNRTIAKLCVH